MSQTKLQNTPSWYAVYTKPRWEKKVAEFLIRKGVEHYCPLNRVVKQWSDRKKTILEPLFKSYVFIRIRKEEMTAVKMVDGVVNLVQWLGKPAVIRDVEIETIKRFLNEHENVQLEKTEVNVSDQISIISGPFLDQIGKVIEVTNKLVKVYLPSLGYSMVAQVAKENVKVVTMYTPNN